GCATHCAAQRPTDGVPVRGDHVIVAPEMLEQAPGHTEPPRTRSGWRSATPSTRVTRDGGGGASADVTAASVTQVDYVPRLPAPALNRSSNVLERLHAAVIEQGVETVAHILMHAAGGAMPPGAAISCRRAATLTPSPKMSSPSKIMSPRLMPMRCA